MPFVPIGPMGPFRSAEPVAANLGDLTSEAGGAALRIGGVGLGAFLSPLFGLPPALGAIIGYLLAAGVSKLGGGT